MVHTPDYIDLYPSRFLYGLTHGMGLADCGHVAGLCAAEIISHIGARPQRPPSEFLTRKRA